MIVEIVREISREYETLGDVTDRNFITENEAKTGQPTKLRSVVKRAYFRNTVKRALYVNVGVTRS